LRRSWTVNTIGSVDASREEILEQELKTLKEQIADIRQQLFNAEKDQPGPSHRKNSILGRLRSSLLQRESDDESEEPPPYSSQESVRSVNLGGTKTVYIKNVQLTLNGIPLDMLETEEGSKSC